jgi:hypothetical protein
MLWSFAPQIWIHLVLPGGQILKYVLDNNANIKKMFPVIEDYENIR